MAVNLSQWQAKENNVVSDWAWKQRQNTFGQQQHQIHGGRGMQDFSQGFQRQLPKQAASFGARGLAGGGMSSGVMRGAMRNYVGDYTRDLGRMQTDFDSQQNQFNTNRLDFNAMKDQQLADLTAQKTEQIAATAAHIQGLAPHMGGF